MNLKLQGRLQEVRDARKVECLPREAATQESGHMWVTASKAIGAGLPKTLGTHILPQCVLGARHGDLGVNVPPTTATTTSGFYLTLV